MAPFRITCGVALNRKLQIPRAENSARDDNIANYGVGAQPSRTCSAALQGGTKKDAGLKPGAMFKAEAEKQITLASTQEQRSGSQHFALARRRAFGTQRMPR